MKIGLIQQQNVADVKQNMQHLATKIRQLAQQGAELIVLQELHNSLYFCQVESVDNFDLAEPIPGPSTDFFGHLAKELGVVIVTSLFERRALAFITTPLWYWRKMAALQANTVRCTFLTTQPTMRSSTSPLATWASTPFRPQ